MSKKSWTILYSNVHVEWAKTPWTNSIHYTYGAAKSDPDLGVYRNVTVFMPSISIQFELYCMPGNQLYSVEGVPSRDRFRACNTVYFSQMSALTNKFKLVKLNFTQHCWFFKIFGFPLWLSGHPFVQTFS